MEYGSEHSHLPLRNTHACMHVIYAGLVIRGSRFLNYTVSNLLSRHPGPLILAGLHLEERAEALAPCSIQLHVIINMRDVQVSPESYDPGM